MGRSSSSSGTHSQVDKCRKQVPALRSAAADQIIYVKEDLIMPHSMTFYELIVNKARGKSGPLFQFDVHDDVRTANSSPSPSPSPSHS